jgi:dolichol-phosphate mannosyltransferase
MVKCGCERVAEVPIHFGDRRFGQSKLTLKQQLLYLQHLRRLYIFKHELWSQLAQFLVVGGVGTIVNLAALTALLIAGLSTELAVAAAIFVSMCSNFVLNRRFSFSYARSGAWTRQFLGFIASSSLGAVVNYATTLLILARFAGTLPQVAALVGIAVGTAFNFLTSRYLVFRTSHVRPDGW